MNAATRTVKSALCGRWLLVFALAVVVSLGGVVIANVIRTPEPSEEQKAFARLAAAHALTLHHWKELETLAEFRPMIDKLNDDINGGFTLDRWSLKLLSGPRRSNELDGFEDAALKLVEKGEDEVWDAPGGKLARYVRAVRASESCLPCHVKTASGNPTKANDVLAIICVERTPRPAAKSKP